MKKDIMVKTNKNLKTASGKILPAGTVFEEPFPSGMLRRAEKKQGVEFIYRNVPITAKKLVVNCDKYITIGMKGLPGRKGLTTHHNKDNNKYKKDVEGALLESILKKDTKYYLDFFP
jgi:hypothetical protein